MKKFQISLAKSWVNPFEKNAIWQVNIICIFYSLLINFSAKSLSLFFPPKTNNGELSELSAKSWVM